jgi:glycosyltransferase involved in cell wall biosynthesis
MHTAGSIIHIVTSLQGLRGGETHAASLTAALRAQGAQVTLWSDKGGPYVSHFGGVAIQPFSGRIPRGGTLILLGTYINLSPWIDHVIPSRLILICNSSDLRSLHTALGRLRHTSLPDVEMVYVSQRLANAMGVPGRICPTLVDLDLFSPSESIDDQPFTIGRHSRDAPDKHHPDDASLYRMLAWRGVRVRVMGGSVLADLLASNDGIELLPVGAEQPAEFLRSLDVFFYRTRPDWHEPSGRAIMEAMACGLPVVAHTSGGYTDWIRHGENGFLFKEQEEAWGYLQELHGDPVLRRQLGTAARASALGLADPAGEPAQRYLDWLCQQEPEEISKPDRCPV